MGPDPLGGASRKIVLPENGTSGRNGPPRGSGPTVQMVPRIKGGNPGKVVRLHTRNEKNFFAGPEMRMSPRSGPESAAGGRARVGL